MKPIIAVIVLAGLLAACGRPYVQDNTPALHEKVAAGDSLVLHREITFLPTDMKVTFQYSENIGNSRFVAGLDKYEADCTLKLKESHFKRIVIPPQTFKITRVETYAEDAGLVDMKYYGIRLYLDSRKNPQVQVLDCHYPDEIYREAPFSVRKFEMAVGEVMSIERR